MFTPSVLQGLTHVFTDIPFNRILGVSLERLAKDQAIISFSMKNELIGNYLHGILHGGVISSVLDMVGGMAILAAAVYKHQDYSLAELATMLGKSSTVDLQISYLHPGKGEKFIATADVLHSGNKISFARMELHNQEQKLLATGAGTYLVG
ncbi:MAG: hypothetical protein A3E83_02715 [Gammaproteobacteria bacterium RIFCSPHIGHO2_12_FULL_41_20]|nr:MAG: hypothetical protein A3E83_02715 [Gammaproteobacteria bacterium RIFCSPHIGHO2_12_FULL_41_20]